MNSLIFVDEFNIFYTLLRICCIIYLSCASTIAHIRSYWQLYFILSFDFHIWRFSLCVSSLKSFGYTITFLKVFTHVNVSPAYLM